MTKIQLNVDYLEFTPSTTDEEIIKRFEGKYGKEPEVIFVHEYTSPLSDSVMNRKKLAGPVPKKSVVVEPITAVVVEQSADSQLSMF